MQRIVLGACVAGTIVAPQALFLISVLVIPQSSPGFAWAVGRGIAALVCYVTILLMIIVVFRTRREYRVAKSLFVGSIWMAMFCVITAGVSLFFVPGLAPSFMIFSLLALAYLVVMSLNWWRARRMPNT